ncbi:hypothetical protein A5699_01140 [Mycobacterium sp. E802]|nr:hypothetical protein A5699_01140 [Mycobacterium sp. E802]
MQRVVSILVLVIALTGCGPMFESEYEGPAEGDYGYGAPEELEPLMARRDAEEVLADRDRMIAEIITALSKIVPGAQYIARREPAASQCGDFGSTFAKQYFSQHFTSSTPVPAPLWNKASQAVIDIAAKYGYTNVTSRTENATGDHANDLTIRDSDGGRLAFGSMEASSIQVTTGCYLTADEKRQARDAAPK